MSESNDVKEVVKKKTKWIIPAMIGVVLVATIAVAVIVIISATAPSRALKNQLDLGNKYLANLDYENAILAYEEVIKIDPMHTEAYLKLSDAYLGIANDKMAAGESDAASELLGQGIRDLQNGYNKTNDPSVEEQLNRMQERLAEIDATLELENLWVITSLKSYKADGGIEFDWTDEYAVTEKGFIKTTYEQGGDKTESYYNHRGYCVKELYYDSTGKLNGSRLQEFDEENHMIKTTAYDANGKISGWAEWIWTDDDIKTSNYDEDGNLIDHTMWSFNFVRIGETEEEYKKLDNDHLGSYKQYFQDEKTLITEYTDGRKTIEHYEKLRDVCR